MIRVIMIVLSIFLIFRETSYTKESFLKTICCYQEIKTLIYFGVTLYNYLNYCSATENSKCGKIVTPKNILKITKSFNTLNQTIIQ